MRLRRPDYDEAALADRVRRVLDRPWERIFVFFKHEDEGAAPRVAAAFEAAFRREARRRQVRAVRPAAGRDERTA